MPQAVPHSQNQSGTPRKTGTRKASTAASGNVGFTFVNQSEDLQSLADKRIVSSQQRHAIRSHVMKSVRHSETLIGKKRPTGRESNRKSVDSCKEQSPSLELSNSPSPSPNVENGRLSSSPVEKTSVACNLQMIKSPSFSSGRLDPFETLPAAQGLYRIIDDITKYCFSTFLPMTYPIETASAEGLRQLQHKVMQSRGQNPATFFGMMATVAAHRALVSGRHRDLRPSNQDHDDLLLDQDFRLLKQKAIRETAKRIKASGGILDEESAEAIFSLLGAASILGNFKEVRLHLIPMRQALQDVDGSLDSMKPSSHWIPLTDLKGAVGMLCRPCFRLPWTQEPMPSTLLIKIAPQGRLRSLGMQISKVPGLSIRLQEIIQGAIQLCWFCQLNCSSGHTLTYDDHQVFKHKTLELEYDLLSYIYQGSPGAPVQIQHDISPIEQMVRLAILGMSSTIIAVLPSSGIGRALTCHQMEALSQWYSQHQQDIQPSRETLQCVLWILLQNIQGAAGQIEAPILMERLLSTCRALKVRQWSDVEGIVYGFLYIPAMQEAPWKKIYHSLPLG